MIVKDIMQTDVYSLNTNATLFEAIKLLETKHVRAVPITNSDNELCGLFTEELARIVLLKSIQEGKQDIFQEPLRLFINESFISAHPMDSAEELAAIFFESNTCCIPVVEYKKLKGIVTERDMLQAFIQLTGVHQPSSQIEISVDDQAGKLAEAALAIKEYGMNINSVLVYPSKDLQQKILVFRIGTMNALPVINHLIQKGFHVIEPHVGEENG